MNDAIEGGGVLGSLVGKTIVGVDVSAGESDLRFRCADGSTVVWSTDGDCCSESWWADGFQLGNLRNAKVRSVEEIPLPVHQNDGRTRQEFDQAYGYRIWTNRGDVFFAFRNSSNGYYGGFCGLGEDGKQEWREIEGEDWSA